MGIHTKTLKARKSHKPPKPPAKQKSSARSASGKSPTSPASRLAARESSAAYVVNAAASSPAINPANALFTTTQQRVLGLLFGQADRSFFANEIINATGAGSGAVQRELARLESSGLVTAHWIGNQKHYQANRDSPVFEGLWLVVQNTVGVGGVLKDALQPLAGQITAAFVYGSVAKQQERAGSDVDVLVVSDSLTYADLITALEPAATGLRRSINPTLVTRAELAKRIAERKAFFTRVLSQPKIWLIGNERDLGI
jgi:predicted nucleotidyltransferase